MKKVFTALIVTVILAVITCFTITAFDGNDYGGGYDGGGYDGGGYDGGGYDGGGYDGGGSSSSGSGGSGTFGIGGAVIIVIIFIVMATSKKSGKGGTVISKQGRNVILPDRTNEIETIIKLHDDDFSASDFITFTKQVYIDIQTAWCNRDLTPVRPVMHENLYNTTCKQVQSKIDQGVVYHYESIAINTAYITSYIRDSQFEYVTCYLNARMIDYQVDEKTGRIIRGDKTTRWDMRYKMKFVRSLGTKTKEETDSAQGHNCPNCGAPLEISSTGQCPYCDSIVTTGQYSWVLTDFTTVRDDTGDEGIRGATNNF